MKEVLKNVKGGRSIGAIRPGRRYIRSAWPVDFSNALRFALISASMENSSVTFSEALQLLRAEGMLPQPDERPRCPLYNHHCLCFGSCVLVVKRNLRTMRRKTVYLCRSCNVYWPLSSFVRPEVLIDIHFRRIRSVRRIAQLVLDSQNNALNERNYQANQTLQ
jgi:hypothetical protein